MDKLRLLFLLHSVYLCSAALFKQSSWSFKSEENYNCPQFGKLPYVIAVSIATLNGTHVIVNGTLATDRSFTNQMVLSVELKQWEKNEWKDKIAKIEKDQACTTTNMILGKPWLDVCREAGVTPGKCPILKGSYKITNFPVEFASAPVLKMLSGRFKLIIQARSGNTQIYCSEHIFKITQ